MASGHEVLIDYVRGDATAPAGQGPKIIAHICNDIGKWGAGFVLAISRRWPQPEATYRASFRSDDKPALGDVQLIEVAPDITVANLIGQAGIRSPRGVAAPPIRYDAVRRGLARIAQHAIAQQAAVHMPRIGCGLAGGRWEEIEPIIMDELCARHVHTTVYDP